MTTKNDFQLQLRGLSRVLQDVHRALLEVARDRYEGEHGTVRNNGEFFNLLLSDAAFAWLRPLTTLIVSIDELVARAPAPNEDETSAVRAAVEELIGADTAEFGTQYVELLRSDPRVAMHHGVLREAIGELPAPERSVRHLPGPHNAGGAGDLSDSSRKTLSGPEWTTLEPGLSEGHTGLLPGRRPVGSLPVARS